MSANNGNIFMCSICDRHLHSKARLISHTLQRHTTGSKTPVDATPEGDRDSEASIQPNYTCPCCSFVGQSETELDDHLSSRCKNYGTYLDRCSSKGKVFNCHTCGYKSKSKTAYKKHLKKHGHYRVLHVFFCPHCDYRTSRRSLMGSHILTHTKVKKYKCDHCPYSAIRSDYLKKHVVTHTKDYRPYKCNFCDYTAVRNDYLKRHVAKHTQYPTVKCADCDFRCGRHSELREHAKIHRNAATFKCTSCDFATKQKDTIVSHVATHSDVSAFVCHDESVRSQCDKCNITLSDADAPIVHQCHDEDSSANDSTEPTFDSDRQITHSVTPDLNVINFISVADCKDELALDESEKAAIMSDYSFGELTDPIGFLSDTKLTDYELSSYPISYISIVKEETSDISTHQDGLILNIDF